MLASNGRRSKQILRLRHLASPRVVPGLVQAREADDLRALRALARNEVVTIAGDRTVGGDSVEVELFGRRTHLSRGIMALEWHTRAPVLLGYAVRSGGTSLTGYCEGPRALIHSGDRERDSAENTQRMGRQLEWVIRCDPDQWMMFVRVWREPDAQEESAMSERERARAAAREKPPRLVRTSMSCAPTV